MVLKIYRPVHLQAIMNDPRHYLLEKFPRLFVAVYEIIRDDPEWKTKRLLRDFFQIPKDFD